PCIAIIVDMTTPCERLKAYADAAFGCMVSKLAQISGGAIDSTDGFWRHIAADQQQVAIKLSHQVEFAFRSGKDPLALDSGHPLEIAEGLECDGPEAKFAHQVTDIRGVPLCERRSFSKISTPSN